MHKIKDNYGQTALDWARDLFEFEYCDACGGDIEDHDYCLLLGNWFAKCKLKVSKRGPRITLAGRSKTA